MRRVKRKNKKTPKTIRYWFNGRLLNFITWEKNHHRIKNHKHILKGNDSLGEEIGLIQRNSCYPGYVRNPYRSIKKDNLVEEEKWTKYINISQEKPSK